MKPSQEWLDHISNLASRIYAMMSPGQTVTFLVHRQPNIIVPNMQMKPPDELIITRAHPELSGSVHIKVVAKDPEPAPKPEPKKEEKGGGGNGKKPKES